jgi:NMD protein affecting ribosome stability and mRNA decay
MSAVTCPRCGNNDQTRIVGIVYRCVYDGVAAWSCQKCSAPTPAEPQDVRFDALVAELEAAAAEHLGEKHAPGGAP